MVEDISPRELDRRRRDGEPWQLLDVREVWEIETASVDDAICIPMGEVPGRLGEIDRDVPVAVLCHSGVRSARVAAFLEQSGFATVRNVAGGIDRWAEDVDPGMPRY